MAAEEESAARVDRELSRVHREEYAAVVGALVRRFGDIELAEDAAGEAFVVAVERWRCDGVPANPGGWLTTTAQRRALDRLRRESTRGARHREATMLLEREPAEPTGAVEDDRLRLVFTCCHPALAPEARVALTLKVVGGLTVPEIAAAFLVPETTMAQRITRAKHKIGAARIPWRVPLAADLPDRLAGVLAVVYLVFNEGYLATSGDHPARRELSDEAIRLGRLLHRLLPDEPEAQGLLALMLLTDARRASRVVGGEWVTLDRQDRGGWDMVRIAEGHALVRDCLARHRDGGPDPGHYQLMAAINAVHTDAADARDTDWSQVVALYDRLLRVSPTPVVALNRAVAVAEVDGPQVALALVERLDLTAYHPWHATRADLLRRLGRGAEARAAYDAAIETCGNDAERRWLTGRRAELAESI